MSKTTTLRRKQIEQIVATRHIVHVQALAKELLVSCETIRKDLAFLEEKGVLYLSLIHILFIDTNEVASTSIHSSFSKYCTPFRCV